MAKDYTLSKSSYIKGLQCEKQLYFYKHNYDLKDSVSEMQLAIFKKGTDTGILAQSLFPDGIDASASSHFKYKEGIEKTSKLMLNQNQTIYEAAFVYDEILVIADIVVKSGNTINVYEVKSGTSVTNVIINDAAIQYHVISNAGYKINDFSIIYINRNYIRDGELDIDSLFKIKSVKQKIKSLQKNIYKNINHFNEILSQSEAPQIGIGSHCTNPYQCSFIGTCWKDVPVYSIFNIAGLSQEKKFDLYNKGITELKNIPGDYPLTPLQWLQVNSELRNEKVIKQKEIKSFLAKLKYPLYFLDFESFQPAVPIFDKSKPYQQIPFQFSLHIKESEDSQLKHYEFLAEPATDPRTKLADALIPLIGNSGSIVVYNKVYEVSILNKIATDFPEYAEDLANILSKIVDLMEPFEKRYYYSPDLKGSYSIKYVLPSLVPELSYAGLAIKEGGEASLFYEQLLHEEDYRKIESVKEALLRYCELDTLAMVKIVERLREISNEFHN
ncbi:MAG: DUF2779 domain-containing protein [Melioribacteraceae bacterium]|nr:DUF2779 domain-containing protein [Melioribacteraceae bacterium]